MDSVLDHRAARGLSVGRAAATAIFLATLVIVGASLVVWAGIGFPRLPMSFVRGPFGVAEIAGIALVYASIGAFLVGRVPGVLVGWGLMAIGVGVGLHLPLNLLLAQAVRAFHPIPDLLLVSAWLLTSLLVPFAAATIALLVMILPDGRLPSRRWRIVTAVTLSGFVLLALGSALTPSGLIWFPTLPNPVSVPMTAASAITAVRVVGVGLLGLGLGLASTCLLARYRRGDAETRRQLRWIMAGGVFWAISLVALLCSRYLLGISDAVGTALTHLAALGTVAVPITILIATIRYHLFGAEVIVSRTLVYVPLLAICSGIYGAGVALSQRLFVALTGNTSDLAIVFATLLAAGAIMPLRRWLETVVDRIIGPASSGRAADPDAAQRDLAEQAAALTSRLADIESQLASLAATPRRDDGLAYGEPGVGRPSSPTGRTSGQAVEGSPSLSPVERAEGTPPA